MRAGEIDDLDRDIEPGDEDFGFPNVVDATVMNSVSVYRDEDGAYTATGYQDFRYSEWAPGEPEDEEGREAVSLTLTATELVIAPPAPGSPPAAGIPEPSLWALMILGFGAAGVSLRRRLDLTV